MASPGAFGENCCAIESGSLCLPVGVGGLQGEPGQGVRWENLASTLGRHEGEQARLATVNERGWELPWPDRRG